MNWDQVPIGTLVDEDINHLAQESLLFLEGFEPARVRQACYELRASDVFYDVSSPRESKRRAVDSSGYLLRPHAFVTAIVKERIQLPSNVLARILTKGQLLSIGILPVNTYADPGFQGRLGITLCNISHRYIVIKPGQPIAKIEFTKLPKPVGQPYSGQHGYETEIWPLPFEHYAEEESDWFKKQLGSRLHEADLSYGPTVSRLVSELNWYSKKVWIQLIVIVSIMAVVAALHGQLSLWISLMIGVGANLVTQFLFPAASRAFRRQSR